MKNYYKTLILILTTIIISISLSFIISPELFQTKTTIVIRIVDGDTLIAKCGDDTKTVRILGIDTPERGEEGYKEAGDRLSELVLEKQIRLDCWKKDFYKRDLCWVYLENQDVAEILISEGLGIRVEPY